MNTLASEVYVLMLNDFIIGVHSTKDAARQQAATNYQTYIRMGVGDNRMRYYHWHHYGVDSSHEKDSGYFRDLEEKQAT